MDGKQALKTYRSLERAMRAGLMRSAHDASDGGFAVAFAESAFAGGLGAEVDLREVPQVGVFRDDYLLFSESQSRFVVTVRPGDEESIDTLFRSVPMRWSGRSRRVRVSRSGASTAPISSTATLRDSRRRGSRPSKGCTDRSARGGRALP